MANYSFLQNLVLVDTGRLREPKINNPEGLAVRVFANGSVYPSIDLVAKFDLEYKNKDVPDRGNGIDVVDSTQWSVLANQPRTVLFGITPKGEAKVDLFASCRFNDDGTPKSSVNTQGSLSTTLLDLVISMGWLKEDQKYVDLKIVEEYPIKTQNGIANIPKVLERGKKKGEESYERRENITFYPVEPTDLESISVETPVVATGTELTVN